MSDRSIFGRHPLKDAGGWALIVLVFVVLPKVNIFKFEAFRALSEAEINFGLNKSMFWWLVHRGRSRVTAVQISCEFVCGLLVLLQNARCTVLHVAMACPGDDICII